MSEFRCVDGVIHEGETFHVMRKGEVQEMVAERVVSHGESFMTQQLLMSGNRLHASHEVYRCRENALRDARQDLQDRIKYFERDLQLAVQQLTRINEELARTPVAPTLPELQGASHGA